MRGGVCRAPFKFQRGHDRARRHRPLFPAAENHPRRHRTRRRRLRRACRAEPVRRRLPGRHERPGPDRQRGPGSFTGRSRTLHHRAARDRDDRPPRTHRDAFGEPQRTVAHHARLPRRRERVLRAPARHGTHHRGAVPPAPRRVTDPRAGQHRPRRGVPVHARAARRRDPRTHRSGADEPPHHPGLGRAAAAALDPGRGGDQLPGRLRTPVPDPRPPGPHAAPPRLDRGRLRRPRPQQRELRRRHPADR